MNEEKYIEKGFDDTQIILLKQLENCEICSGTGVHIEKIQDELYGRGFYEVAHKCPIKRKFNEYTEEKLKEQKSKFKKFKNNGWDDFNNK